MKLKWRGTIIAVASVIAFNLVFYGGVDQNSSSWKILLWIIFVIGFIGGTLAVVDSARQIGAARRKMHEKSGEKR